MAKAKKNYIEKEVTKIEKVPDGVTLELTDEEAETLLIIFDLIGGPPAGRRGIVREICRSLKDVGFSRPQGFHLDDKTALVNRIYFK